MAKINWSSVVAAERVYYPFDFTDENPTIGKFSVQLRRPLSTEIDAADEGVKELVAMHVTGGYRTRAGVWVKDPVPFPMFDEALPGAVLTESTLRTMARIVAMQPEGDEKLTITDLVWLSQTATTAYPEFEAVAMAIMRGATPVETTGGNGAGESSEKP